MAIVERIDLRPLEFGEGRALLNEMMRADPEFKRVDANVLALVANDPRAYFGDSGDSSSFASQHILPPIRSSFFRLMDRAPQDLFDAYVDIGKSARRFGTWAEIALYRSGGDGRPGERFESAQSAGAEKIFEAYEAMAEQDHMVVFELNGNFVPDLFDVVSAPRGRRFTYRMGFDLLNGYAVLNRGDTSELVESGIEAAYRSAFGADHPYYAPAEVQQQSGSSRLHVEMRRSDPALVPFKDFVSDSVQIDHSGRIILNIDRGKRPDGKPLILTYQGGAEKPISPPVRPLSRVEIPVPKGVEPHEFANVLQMASQDASRFSAEIFFEGAGGFLELEEASADQLSAMADQLAADEVAALMAFGVDSSSAIAAIYASMLAAAPIR